MQSSSEHISTTLLLFWTSLFHNNRYTVNANWELCLGYYNYRILLGTSVFSCSEHIVSKKQYDLLIYHRKSFIPLIFLLSRKLETNQEGMQNSSQCIRVTNSLNMLHKKLLWFWFLHN